MTTNQETTMTETAALNAYSNDELTALQRDLAHPSFGWRRTELLRAVATIEEMREAGNIVAKELEERDREAAIARIHTETLEREAKRTQELFDALRRDTGIEARTGEELVAGVVNALARLRMALVAEMPLLGDKVAEVAVAE